MSIISFLKEAGEKLFKTTSAAPAATASPASAQDVAGLNETAAAAIKKYIATQDLSVQGLDVKFDGATQTVTVRGEAKDQATREKTVLCCGNVAGVAKVDDQLTVASAGEKPASFHTVKSGDSLSKIAKQVYGDANAYMQIFEANKPMLSHPDKIYPGQSLRIPAA